MKQTKAAKSELGDRIYAAGKNWSKESYARMRKYQTAYNREKYKSFTIRFPRGRADEEIAWLENQPSSSDCVLQLVRAAMAKEKQNK